MRVKLGIGVNNAGDMVSLKGGFADLSSVVSNMELELDASVAASYSGSGQTWSNLIAIPDSGASQTDNDFFLGADGSSSTDDPTFNVDTFDLDGGDFFATVISGNTTFMQEMNFSTSPHTYIMVFDIGGTFSSDALFGSGLTVADGAILLREQASNGLQIFQQSGGSFLNVTQGSISINSTNMIIVSIDGPNDRVLSWINSRTPITTTSAGFDTTDTDLSTVDANIAAQGGTNFLSSGHSIKLFALRNRATTDAEAELIFDLIESAGRHDIDYTP